MPNESDTSEATKVYADMLVLLRWKQNYCWKQNYLILLLN